MDAHSYREQARYEIESIFDEQPGLVHERLAEDKIFRATIIARSAGIAFVPCVSRRTFLEILDRRRRGQAEGAMVVRGTRYPLGLDVRTPFGDVVVYEDASITSQYVDLVVARDRPPPPFDVGQPGDESPRPAPAPDLRPGSEI